MAGVIGGGEAMGKNTLSADELSAKVAGLSGWKIADGGKAIEKAFEFPDFGSAFGFMTQVALKAEKLDHHPDWSNVYSRVSVALSTHSAGGVTALDLELAAFMDSLIVSTG